MHRFGAGNPVAPAAPTATVRGSVRGQLQLLLLAGAFLAVGCTGQEATSTTSQALTPAELGWVRAYTVWTIDVYDEDLGPAPGLELVRECERRLETLGEPPTSRLEPVARRAAAVCPLLARRGSYRRALDVVDDADDLVRPLFLDSQELQLRSGATKLSRADVDLSALASKRAETAVEVRCWSPEDWRRVVGEDNAWADDSRDAEDLYGWQDEGDSRVHMRLAQCNELIGLRTADVLALDHDAQLEVADSLDTLAHELQHFVLPDADEAEVECAAIPTIRRLAERLGASPDEAVLLARLQRTEIYPNQPDEYVTPGGCEKS
jgi:hypothetical protein